MRSLLSSQTNGPSGPDWIAEGGFLLSYDKAQRHRVWDAIERAANEKTIRERLKRAKAEIGHKLGKQALKEVATIVKPDTILMDLAAPEVQQKLLDAQLLRQNASDAT